jgi:HSP20 family protein
MSFTGRFLTGPSGQPVRPDAREDDMTVTASWDLFEDLRDAQDELMRINRLRAQRLGQISQAYGGGATASAWMPSVDISERKDAYLVALELPGVGTDDVEITFQDGLMTIQGERHNTHNTSEEKVHRMERRYGPFLRSITLPSHVMADEIEASAHDGVLQILVPKAAEVHAKRIQVRANQTHTDAAPAATGELTA